jgi:hypothetical protein
VARVKSAVKAVHRGQRRAVPNLNEVGDGVARARPINSWNYARLTIADDAASL